MPRSPAYIGKPASLADSPLRQEIGKGTLITLAAGRGESITALFLSASASAEKGTAISLKISRGRGPFPGLPSPNYTNAVLHVEDALARGAFFVAGTAASAPAKAAAF